MNKEAQIMEAFGEILNKRAWLDKFKMEESLKGYKPSEVHCIEYIGRHADAEPNVTKLAEAFYMTRGAISKLTKKMIQKGILEGYQKPDNKKELYFRLTQQGKEVYRIHEDLHREFQDRDKEVFEQLTEAQFKGILNFVDSYGRHLNEEIKRQGMDILEE